jgi:hypothetical protein
LQSAQMLTIYLFSIQLWLEADTHSCSSIGNHGHQLSAAYTKHHSYMTV